MVDWWYYHGILRTQSGASVNSENRKITPPGPPPPYLIFTKTSTAPKLGISHLMIPLMDALGVSHLGKIEFRSYGHLKTADSYT